MNELFPAKLSVGLANVWYQVVPANVAGGGMKLGGIAVVFMADNKKKTLANRHPARDGYVKDRKQEVVIKERIICTEVKGEK